MGNTPESWEHSFPADAEGAADLIERCKALAKTTVETKGNTVIVTTTDEVASATIEEMINSL